MPFAVEIDVASCEKALAIAEEISSRNISEEWGRCHLHEVLSCEGFKQMLLHHAWSLEEFLNPLVQCAYGWQPEHDILEENPWGIVGCAYKLWCGLVDQRIDLLNSVSYYKTEGRRVAERETRKVAEFFAFTQSVDIRFFVVPGGHSGAYAAGRMASDVVVVNPLMFHDESFEAGICLHESCHLASEAICGKWRPVSLLQQFIDKLVDEGQAVYISKILSDQGYSFPEEEATDDLIMQMNRDLCDFRQSTNEDVYQELQDKWFSWSGPAYRIGEAMCYAVDRQLGRDVLLSCIQDGPPMFLRTYNSICGVSNFPSIDDFICKEVGA